MSKLAYEFLTNSFLFNDSLLEEGYSSLSEKELLSEFQKYREFCLANSQSFEEEILSTKSNLKLFSGTDVPQLELLRQCAFYVEQFVISDPIFPLSERFDENDVAFNKLFQMESSRLNRKRLIEKIKYLKMLRPMIKANYVKILPITFYFERPKQIPYRYSESGFADVLPESLLNFFHENAVVESVKDANGAKIIDGSFEIGRGIHIRFKNHGIEDARGYQLVEERVLSVDEKNRTVENVIYIPKHLPDKATFERWIFQSINQTAEHLYNRALFENELAIHFDSAYLCKTPFLFELLEQAIPTEENIQTNTVNSLLNFNLPFMEKVNTETLMQIRLNDGEAFQNFRLELDKQLKQLRLITEENELKVKTENIIHEISEVQVVQVEQKLQQIKRQISSDILIAMGGLIGAVQLGGISLLAVALAAIKGYKSYNEYISLKQQNPSFFLWKVLKNSKQNLK